VVEAVGPGVTNVQVGDRVVVAFQQSCGYCDRCTTGRPNLCQNSQTLNRIGRIKLNGTPMMQFAGMSAFAEKQLVRKKACV
jgi:Zn-dependent alcohol dehydrogenase